MAFVPVPRDLSRVKTKIALNLTKRQLICFSIAAAIGIPTYLITRGVIGNTAAVMLMIFLMLPAFFVAMYEKDGQPAEKILKNILRSRYFFPRLRPYKTENFYNQIDREGRIFECKTKKANTPGSKATKNIQSAKENKNDFRAYPKKYKVKQAGVSSSLMQRLFGTKTAPVTAQQSIPYKEMYRDGICRVNEKLYTKTIIFDDINYQLAQNEDKTQIFDSWCDFLNYFDSTISIQLSFVNQYGNAMDFEKSIDIPDRQDDFNSIRREYADMLKNQLAKGNNGLVKKKYITFGIEATNLRDAKPKLERIEADIIGNFKTLGVKAVALNGSERLEILHGSLHPDGKEKLRFDWKDLPRTGLSTKDYIAPTSFDFRDSKIFRMGATYGAVSYIQIIAPELTDRLLADFLDMNNAVTVNLHIKSIDQTTAIKTIKRKITELDAMKINEQKKAVRSGYDMDVIPTDIATYGDEAKNMLKELQSRNERMFLATVIVLNTAESKRKLENTVFAAAGIAQKYNCALKRLDFQQEQGLMSSLPIGTNQIEIQRGLTTSSTAIFVPFTTCELFMSGQSLYYGINALSNNLIMANRKELKNPKGLYSKGRWEYLLTKQSTKAFAVQMGKLSILREIKRRGFSRTIRKLNMGRGSLLCSHLYPKRLMNQRLSLCR